MANVAWKTGVSGSWQIGTNWTGGAVPAIGDDALLTAAGSYTVTSGSFVEVHSVQLIKTATLDIVSGGFRLDDGTGAGANSGHILVENANQLTLAGGTLDNAGTISLNSAGNTTQITIAAPSVTLTGGGAIVMSANGNNYIDGNNAGFQLINADNTISGAGHLGNNDLTIVNQSAGVIDASSAATLDVQTQSVLGNAGLMEATAGGIMAVNSTRVNNAGGKVLADGGTVDLNSSALYGGTIQTLHGGTVQTTSGTNYVDGIQAGAVTISGTLTVGNATILNLSGTINDAVGTIDLAGSSNTTQIQLGSYQVMLQGGGALVLSNSENNYIQASYSLQQQLINVDDTISGSGHIGNGNMTLVNQAKGIIDANNGSSGTSTGVLTINADGGVNNFGLLEDTGTAGLIISGSYVYQSGAKAIIEAKGAGTHVDLANSTVVGGTLTTTGSGVIQTVSGNGELDGLNAGAITNKGKFLINNGTFLYVDGVLNNTGAISETSTGNTTEFRLNSVFVTLQGGGTLALSDNANNYILSSFSTWQTFTNADNTISGSGNIGNGGMQFVNGGTVDATGSVAQLVIDVGSTSTGVNDASGLWEGTGSQGLVLTNGLYTNDGTVEALNGSAVTYTSSATNVNLSGGVLAGGAWKAVSTGGPATVAITGGSVVTDAAAIFLSGTGSVFEAGNGSTFATIETTLTTIAAGGSLSIAGGRAYTTTLSLTDSGTLTLAGAATTLIAGAITVASGGVLTGNGMIKTSVTNTGSVVASGGVLDFTKSLTGSGSATIKTGATLEVDGNLTSKNVVFAAGGSGQVLALSKPLAATSTIAGFGKGTTIDLLNTGVTKLSYAGTASGGTLTVRSGTSTVALLKFSGNYTTKSFSFASDGHNGTNIVGTGSLAADLTSVHGFNAAASLAHWAGPAPLVASDAGGRGHVFTPMATDMVHTSTSHTVC